MNSFCKIVYTTALLKTFYSSPVFCMDILGATQTGNTARVRELLGSVPETARIALVNQQDYCGWTPLHWAAFYGQTDIARIFLDTVPEPTRIALVNQQDDNGKTTLHLSVSNGHTNIARMLLDAIPETARIALVNKQTNYGLTPLHLSTSYGRTKIAQMLIAYVPKAAQLALVNQQDTAGWTHLHLAAFYGQTDIARIFIATGAHIDEKDKQGQTPLQIARSNNHIEIANLIERNQQRIANARLQTTIIAKTIAQALHHRIGTESPVAMMDQDLLRYVTVLVGQANEQEARQQD